MPQLHQFSGLQRIELGWLLLSQSQLQSATSAIQGSPALQHLAVIGCSMQCTSALAGLLLACAPLQRLSLMHSAVYCCPEQAQQPSFDHGQANRRCCCMSSKDRVPELLAAWRAPFAGLQTRTAGLATHVPDMRRRTPPSPHPWRARCRRSELAVAAPNRQDIRVRRRAVTSERGRAASTPSGML